MHPVTDTIIIIPAYNPDAKCLATIEGLVEAGFEDIVVVDDGSKPECGPLFDRMADMPQCHLLHHAVNQGKGRALKTAFNHCLLAFPERVGAITADADGQHAVEDIVRMAEALLEHPRNLILGCRDFGEQHVPFKSRWGNRITRGVFSFASGLKISDTQTGLRGIPTSFMGRLLNVAGERFEYETNMLLECRPRQVGVTEVPIRTIYLERNKSTHFNPLLDSARIYSLFLKYIFSAFFSFALDIGLFYLLSLLLDGVFPQNYILAATAGARVVSSFFNFLLNRNAVFGVGSRISVIKYYIICIIQMLLSAFTVQYIHSLVQGGAVLIKLIVDVILFLFSFRIQQRWVFKPVKQCD